MSITRVYRVCERNRLSGVPTRSKFERQARYTISILPAVLWLRAGVLEVQYWPPQPSATGPHPNDQNRRLVATRIVSDSES